METDLSPVAVAAVIERLKTATNRHDLDALEACFAAEYRNETPAHPERGFSGRRQVRRNWEQIFAMVPDVSASILQMAVVASTAWTEWEMRGTRGDGSPHLMRGVIIFGVTGAEITSARFYLEPVTSGGPGPDEAVRKAVGAS